MGLTSNLELKQVNGCNKIVGYASVFEVADQHNDATARGAFLEAIKKHHTDNHIKLLWQHDITKPIGTIASIREDDYGLLVECLINQDTQQGREATSLIKQGAVSGLSIGFIIKDYHICEGMRRITNLDLWEISVVTFPANTQAQINYLTCQNNYQDLALLANNLARTTQYITALTNQKL